MNAIFCLLNIIHAKRTPFLHSYTDRVFFRRKMTLLVQYKGLSSINSAGLEYFEAAEVGALPGPNKNLGSTKLVFLEYILRSNFTRW